QTCAWAPSKVVIDAVDGPSVLPGDAVSLAAWFAEQMQAKELLVIDAPAPKTSVAVRHVSRIEGP
ncbi:MAG: diguanylate cyclase, partial [Loktanella sp.]|nr:diguanylate cyclase [Loktanella sp.]